MTNKLVVIINSLKSTKFKKILLYEMKFLVPNYSCLQNPWVGGYRPQISVLFVLFPKLNLLNPPPPNKIPGYATASSLLYIYNLRYCSLLPSYVCIPDSLLLTFLDTQVCCYCVWCATIVYCHWSSVSKCKGIHLCLSVRCLCISTITEI